MFKLKIVFCLISVNFFKDEKYVLSTSKDNIIFPSLYITDTNLMNTEIMKYISGLFINDPKYGDLSRVKFISFNSSQIKTLFPDDDNTIHILYGGTMPNLETVPDYHWNKFDYMDLNINKELSIINNTIQHVI